MYRDPIIKLLGSECHYGKYRVQIMSQALFLPCMCYKEQKEIVP